jgi:hypothetical protein
MSTAVQVYHALIQPHFDYCCSVWDGLGETLSTKLQKLQNRAVRVIMRTSYDTNADVLLDILHLDNLSLRRIKLKIGLVSLAAPGLRIFFWGGGNLRGKLIFLGGARYNF